MTKERWQVTLCPECGDVYMPDAMHSHRIGCSQPPQDQTTLVPAQALDSLKAKIQGEVGGLRGEAGSSFSAIGPPESVERSKANWRGRTAMARLAADRLEALLGAS